jgi:hypothetical protein
LEIKEHTCIDVCTKKYYTPLKTPKTENRGGVDMDDVNAKQKKINFELTKTIVERISLKKKT